jgi:hypothetical protein
MENVMKLLTKSDMQHLSFPDSIIKNMQFDIPSKIVKIKTDAGYLSKNDGIKVKNCELFVTDWDQLKISLYRAKTKQWEKLDEDKIEKLVDICEFEYKDKIVFRGFGEESGQWIEIMFISATLKVECDYYVN